MKILSRYLIRQLTITSAFCLVAFLAIFVFFDVLGEIDNLGKDHYNLFTLTAYVVLLLPQHTYELMPLAVLIGAVITMSQLAAHSEYTVMKTSGVSLTRFILIMLQFGMVFAVITAILGEWAAPQSAQAAQRVKLSALKRNVALPNQSGIWLKDGQDFYLIGEMLPDGTLKDITQYRYNDTFELVQAAHAQSGRLAAGQWQLNDVALTRLFADHTETIHEAALNLPTRINPALLESLVVEPEQMSLLDLNRYIAHLQDNRQDVERYRVAWWRKLTYPLLVLAMGQIGLAATPQQRRSGNMGLRLFVGIAFGILFHFANRFFGYTNQLYHVPAFVAATLPTLLLFIGAVWMMMRREQR